MGTNINDEQVIEHKVWGLHKKAFFQIQLKVSPSTLCMLGIKKQAKEKNNFHFIKKINAK